MREREVRAEVDRIAKLAQGSVVIAAQPERAPHRPMGRRIAVVGAQRLRGHVVGARDLLLPLAEAQQERVLEMREGEAGIGPRHRRVEPHRQLEEPLGPLVVRLVEAVHVPEAAMQRLPRVHRSRRLEDGAVALCQFDFRRDRTHDLVDDGIFD